MSCRIPITLLLLVGLLPLVGCGSSTPASFRVREDVTKLMEGRYDREKKRRVGDARGKVTETVNEFFGSPSDLVVWERLPVDFGGHHGKVVVPEDPDYDTDSSIKVEWLATAAAVERDEAEELGGAERQPAAKLRIPAGTRAIYRPVPPKVEEGEEPPETPEPTELVVAAYDHESGVLTFTEALPMTPEAGAKLLIDPGEKLKYGKRLYLEHCMHCHGVTGDGNGPTARYLNPKPRDYRSGVFKFTSTNTTQNARREDLARIVRNGIPGTYMPSFLLLTDDEMSAIVEYVRWLACRGRVEQYLADDLSKQRSYTAEAYSEADREGREALIDEFEAFLASSDEFDSWTAVFRRAVDTAVVAPWTNAEAESALIVPTVPRIDPTEDPESIARGRKLYEGGKAKCVNCHGPAGKGDGLQTRDFQLVKGTTKTHAEPGLYDDWGNPIAPRNLTLGLYRGGRRPLDLFYRIKAGIKGTPMPAAAVSDAEIWDLVNYVMSLPYDAPPATSEPGPEATAGEPSPVPGDS